MHSRGGLAGRPVRRSRAAISAFQLGAAWAERSAGARRVGERALREPGAEGRADGGGDGGGLGPGGRPDIAARGQWAAGRGGAGWGRPLPGGSLSSPALRIPPQPPSRGCPRTLSEGGTATRPPPDTHTHSGNGPPMWAGAWKGASSRGLSDFQRRGAVPTHGVRPPDGNGGRLAAHPHSPP